jgi:hypothetical protein
MKNAFFRCLVALFAASLFGCNSGEFHRGDAIVLDEVSPGPGKLKIGDVVRLRGHYTLESQAQATIMVSLTTSESHGPVRVSPKSRAVVDAGSGSFELEYEITDSGVLHVSFIHGGSPFGSLEIADVL